MFLMFDIDQPYAETSLINEFARVARTESEGLKFTTFDIQQAYSSQKAEIMSIVLGIITQLGLISKSGPEECEFIFRDDYVHIPRLIPNDFLNIFQYTDNLIEPRYD